MRRLTWPDAFVICFAGLPALVFLVAAAVAFPAVVLPMLTGAALFVLGDRAGRRRAAVAERAAINYPRNTALVAAPLPPLPTVPIPMHNAPTTPRLPAMRR